MCGINCGRKLRSQTRALMAKSAVEASPFPESKIMEKRARVDPMTSPPYLWICSLEITDAYGEKWSGTGFKLNNTIDNTTMLVTAGHCTYVRGAYAASIKVKFPDTPTSFTVTSKNLYASPEYISNGDPDYDYGLILITNQVSSGSGGFGWSTQISDSKLDKCSVTICGYPTDKPSNTMWVTGGKITSCNTKRIFYTNDSISKQSGCPVYVWHDGLWTVIGVHSFGGSPNSATRFTIQMMSQFLRHIGCKKVLESVHFPNVYLRCNGNRVTKFVSNGGGEVNCQYAQAQAWEVFYIIPLEMPPSLVKKSSLKVAIETSEWENVFLRMEAKNLTEFESTGGGVVNLQFGTGEFEKFILKQEGPKNVYSITSAKFTKCRLRIDGKGVDEWIDAGSGVVNCQYYEDINRPAKSYEKIQIIRYEDNQLQCTE